MISRFFKSVGANIGLIALLSSSVGLLGWWWDVKFNERMSPISENIKLISIQLSRFESYQETLRLEVKKISETKVDKAEFRDSIVEIDNRMNTLEMGEYFYQENENIHK